jgi:excisionase family DNA binding protein
LIDEKDIVSAFVQAVTALGLADEVACALSSRATLATDRLRTDPREIIREELSALLPGGAPQSDRLMTAGEVANYTGVTPATVRLWVKEGKVAAIQAGRQWRFRREDVGRALRSEKAEPVDINKLAAEIVRADAAGRPKRGD